MAARASRGGAGGPLFPSRARRRRQGSGARRRRQGPTREDLREPAEGLCPCSVFCSSGIAHEEAHSEPVSRLRFHPRRAGELLSAGDDGLLCALDCRRCEAGR
ncbi:unnamed protein product [Prorocentrum cordatum]|uniref:Uncharacterized protein n=1 Tax=Prorocentrum cordatum TaxID=2364126 RepID=A0ABN9Q368_9DINO|nr:unnamed protein product [Polarella glacialis]